MGEPTQVSDSNFDQAVLQAEMPVLVDGIDNPLWCTYGRRPNLAYLIGMDGRIVLQ